MDDIAARYLLTRLHTKAQCGGMQNHAEAIAHALKAMDDRAGLMVLSTALALHARDDESVKLIDEVQDRMRGIVREPESR